MKLEFLKYLFEKHIYVSSGNENENVFETLYSLAKLFNIKISEGAELADRNMISLTELVLGEKVPEPFYRGFPESVRKLSGDELLFDQMIHYSITYGLGHFESSGHSIVEEYFERHAFNEKTEIREFKIVTEEKAVELIRESADGLLGGSRPLSEKQFELVLDCIREYDYFPKKIASKNTAIKLLIHTKNVNAYGKYLALSDIIKFTDELNYFRTKSENMKKLNLKNTDRKLITALIDKCIYEGRADIKNCYEKKKLWAGLLHHIHYKAKNSTAEEFVNAMRGSKNLSSWSAFEKAMAADGPAFAAAVLKKEKGGAALLRNLNYLLSRCKTEEEADKLIDSADSDNIIVLLQLYIRYRLYSGKKKGRSFIFTKYGLLKVHNEKPEEMARRRSDISAETAEKAADKIERRLKEALVGRLGKVYISPEMKKYTLPLKESTAQGGFGVLSKGSRIYIGEAKKIRAFTYWEKVDDIDLSAIGMDEEGRQIEFSWRTMANRQSSAITYSGDETSGYNGGSEYYDIDTEEFRKEYPGVRYIVLCNNVYSLLNFSKCVCRAGYMLRDVNDSGQIYEPKTVKSAFSVNAESTFAYLFGLDLATNEFVWLNTARQGSVAVAGETSLAFLLDYFAMAEVMNMEKFFNMLATERVSAAEDADVVICSSREKVPELDENIEVIREYDVDRILKYMEKRS